MHFLDILAVKFLNIEAQKSRVFMASPMKQFGFLI
jgi:hypothetical protein